MMLIEFRGGCFSFPDRWCRLDLDLKRDRETFENMDWLMAAEHLYEGESIEIRCIKRADE